MLKCKHLGDQTSNEHIHDIGWQFHTMMPKDPNITNDDPFEIKVFCAALQWCYGNKHLVTWCSN